MLHRAMGSTRTDTPPYSKTVASTAAAPTQPPRGRSANKRRHQYGYASLVCWVSTTVWYAALMPPPAFTLNQLRIFLAVAHSRSLTQAAKILDQTQPSLSQHIAKLEDAIGQLLFQRGRGQLELTDAGTFLLRRAEIIMAEVDEAVRGLADHAKGVRGVLSVGMLSSIARNLLPDVQARMAETFPDVELDVHEVAPAEALEMLYTRRLTVAVVSAGSIASGSLSFTQTPVFSDPYVLAVPRGLDLEGVTDPESQLDPDERRLLNSVVQFTFGSTYQLRIAGWYQTFLPAHHVISHVRSYELALAMVQARRGVTIVPALSTRVNAGTGYDVTLYNIGMEDRRVVALVPSQYRNTEPQATFIAALRAAGDAIQQPAVEPAPPFLRQAFSAAAAGQ
jgi:LysR family transcriptional regulator, transcription activator of glutamate synthase operon